MWSTIASLKDNFAQIANDVLDTADELENEEDRNGAEKLRDAIRSKGITSTHADLDLQDDVDLDERPQADIEAELRWYKAEVERLSSNDSDIQALSTNYSNLLRERELDNQRLLEQNNKLAEELRTVRQELGSQDESKKLQEKIKAISEELQRSADANQEQLAALQDHHQRQTTALLLKHKKELEEVRAEAPQSANRHESNGFVSPEDVQRDVQAATQRAQEAEAALQRVQEEGKAVLQLLKVKEGENGQLKASLDQSKAKLTDLEGHLANEGASLGEVHQQLQKKRNELADARQRIERLQGEQSQLSAEVRRWRVEKEEAETASKMLREQLQEALSQSESLSSQLKARETELETSSKAGRGEVDELKERLSAVQREAAASRTANLQAYEQEKARLLEEHERRVGELQRTIEQQEERLGALSRERREGEGDAAAAKDEELSRIREKVETLQERLQSSETASSQQAAEHEKRLAQSLEEAEKAKRDLARLKQHLLDKAEEESEKMSEDSVRIADLEARCAGLELRRKALEEQLATAQVELERERATSTQDVQATAEEVTQLRAELEEALASLTSKDMELVNLNSALGQYYAETEAKERLQGELHQTREELSRLSLELETAQKTVSAKEAEKASVAEKVAAAESRVLAAEKAKSKLQDEVDRLRKALEQSMTRIHRMSSDSDQYVDRRIVIKLLITYFEKRHSGEVLDLMARILGFSEEDKKRVGLARVGSERRGVVSGVLGAPGRIVGAVFGGASAPPSPRASMGDKDLATATFTDLWIDFLLKEAQQQEEQRRIDERAAEERTAVAALSDEPFTLPRSRSSLSPRPSISITNLPGVYNPTSSGANQLLSPTTSGTLPGVYYPSTPSPRQAAASNNGDKRRSSISDIDPLMLPSPRSSGLPSGGEFSPVPLTGDSSQR